jgi:hypothetical protein
LCFKKVNLTRDVGKDKQKKEMWKKSRLLFLTLHFRNFVHFHITEKLIKAKFLIPAR